ncbi:putative sphingosine kinase [Helianthus annuus]|nr:putative sphingosine kinase [Helianthus annuus]
MTGRPKKLFLLLTHLEGEICFQVFTDHVKPILEDANIEYTLQETKYQLHAKEVAHDLDLTKYDGILCVVNGLLERETGKSRLKIPIGVIPAGTGNGMIKSLLDSAGQTMYSCLCYACCHSRCRLIADIDIESEQYRWMGSARMDLYNVAWGSENAMAAPNARLVFFIFIYIIIHVYANKMDMWLLIHTLLLCLIGHFDNLT